MSITTELSPLEPGSIKDRVVCAVQAIGAHATRSGIRASVVCDASILEIAIDALERDGYLHVDGNGHYSLHPSLVPSYVFNRNDVPATATSAARLISTTQDGDDVMTMKRCTGPCGLHKPPSEFYTGSAKCKRCVLDRQAELKKDRQGKQAVKPAKAAAKQAPRVAAPRVEVPETLVIPASGEIRCTAMISANAVALKQHDQEIVCSYDQLRMLCDFGTALLRART